MMAESTGPNPTRRHLLTGGVVIAGASLAAPSTTQMASAAAPCMVGRNVRDFGAKGDGVTDDTAAFNRATQASDPWSASLAKLISVPAGRYRIDGTVYIRKGQHLHGDGEPTVIDARRAKGRTFVLGSGIVAGKAQQDPGGAPVQISDLQTLGSAPSEPLIFTDAQGFAMRRLFLSAVGTGIHVTGADGLITDILVDQALNGIVLDACQNINISNLITYLANYAITMKTGTHDTTITAAQFCYSKYAALLLFEGAQAIQNVRVSASSFTMNQQFDTFIGYVHCRAINAELAFDNCSFRNWPGYAIDQAAGANARFSFANCQFDGRATSTQYNGADSSKGISTGASGQFRFVECEFRHLHGEIVRARPGLESLTMVGGLIEACPLPRVRTMAGDRPPISMRDVAGLAVANGDSAQMPGWAGARWEVVLRLQNNGREVLWRGRLTSEATATIAVVADASNAPPARLGARFQAEDNMITLQTPGATIAAVDLRTGA